MKTAEDKKVNFVASEENALKLQISSQQYTIDCLSNRTAKLEELVGLYEELDMIMLAKNTIRSEEENSDSDQQLGELVNKELPVRQKISELKKELEI